MARKFKTDSWELKISHIRQNIWLWLSNLPEYREDSRRSPKSNERPKDFRKRIKTKWGFYPLSDPLKKYPGPSFNSFIENRLKSHNLHLSRVSLALIEDNKIIKCPPSDYYQKQLTPPEVILISINYKGRVKDIQNQLSHILNKIRKYYGVREKKPQAEIIQELLQLEILTQSNSTESQKKFDEKFKTPNEDALESFRRKKARRYKRVSA